MRAVILALALMVPAGAAAEPAARNGMHVVVSGLRNDSGQIVCELYASPETFLKGANRAVARTSAPIAGRSAACEFADIPPGQYAISVFHDENGNGKLDTNFLGIPREGVGTSNNPKGHFGPPRFAEASFQYSGGRLEMTIRVTYL